MFPSQEEVRRIRERYPVGAKVVVDHMGYDPHPIPDGTKGMVQHVDDAGTVHCTCENGRSLGLIPGEDSFHIVKMIKGKDAHEWLLWLLFTPVVIWLALLVAPCRGGSILNVFDKLTVALETPWQITWVDNSAQTIALFLILYGGGVAVYYSTRPKLREGEEHGSAKWGSPRQLNSQIAQKDSFPLTKHVRIGMDTHKHRRNLNILVLGGSGAGKTRSMALPNIMQANCSYVITDPNG